MTTPFSGIPDPGFPRWSRRGLQRRALGEAFQRVRREARRYSQDLGRHSKNLGRYSRELWQRGKRNPRALALIGGALTLTLVGAYTLNASGVGPSLCPVPRQASSPNSKPQKAARFAVLMDPVAHPVAGSELEIYYDVCGLPSGTPYLGRIEMIQQRTGGKKGSAKPKPLAFTFQDKADGLGTRRREEFELGSTAPGFYTVELSVVDSQGRERKKLQKIRLKPR
jgi:hypothetical protein